MHAWLSIMLLGAVWAGACGSAPTASTIPPSVEAHQRADGSWDIEFRLRAAEALTSVGVAGDFNRWDPARLPMSRGADGVWAARASMPPKRALYKFVGRAAAGSEVAQWFADPRNPVHEADGHGGYNSVLDLSAGRARASTTDGINALTINPYSLPDHSSFTTPEWAKNAIWYQVFPERFRSGVPSNDPAPVRPWRSSWYEPSPWEGKDGQSFFNHFVFSRRYGGDLQGLRWALPYLKSLGINAIYLNPIFQARSPHKYEATNYLHVDEHFGTLGDYATAEAKEDLLDPSTWMWTPSDLEFRSFLNEAKSQGFRVVIDGVFNHVGTAHPAFRDVQANGKASRYADWFDVTSWEPFEYKGWADIADLPAFRKDEHGLASPSLRQHLFSVTRRWMDPDGDGDPSDGVDGWRLDVAQEIPIGFWREWCAFVRAINPNAYIVGEIWTVEPEWVDGRCFDAVMNYPFAKAVLPWLAQGKDAITVSAMDLRLRELREAYPAQITYAVQNLYDSHDTDRLASMLLNRDLSFKMGSREQENASYRGERPGPDEYARARLAALIQMTYIGAPMVYYGDEVGMYGADDPTNRKPMLWKDLEPYDAPGDAVDEVQLDWYRRAIALRASHPALRTGSFATCVIDDARQLWGFTREDEHERLVVVVNASTQPQEVDLQGALGKSSEGSWQLVFDGLPSAPGRAFRDASIPPLSARVWRKTK